MMTQPYDPVSSCIELECGFLASPFYSPPYEIYGDWPYEAPVAALHVTLANSQRVIVRVLSEERKAARAMRKRVNKAVEANR